MSKVYDEKKDAIRITANLEDFDGDTQKWKLSFYEVWRWQMTWDFAYEISVRESRRSGVYLDMLIKPSYLRNVLDNLEMYGYRNVKHSDESIGIVYGCEHDECMGIDNIIIDF